MRKAANEYQELPVFLSLIDTGTSTIRMLFKVWEAVSQEDRAASRSLVPGGHTADPNKGIAA